VAVNRGALAILKQTLRASPLELIFSGVRGQASVLESVYIQNVSGRPLAIADVALAGAQVGLFRIAPFWPRWLAWVRRRGGQHQRHAS
jgi:hypothetical protein